MINGKNRIISAFLLYNKIFVCGGTKAPPYKALILFVNYLFSVKEYNALS